MPVSKKAPYVLECGSDEARADIGFYLPTGQYVLIDFWPAFEGQLTLSYSDAGKQLAELKRALRRGGCTKVTSDKGWPS